MQNVPVPGFNVDEWGVVKYDELKYPEIVLPNVARLVKIFVESFN